MFNTHIESSYIVLYYVLWSAIYIVVYQGARPLRPARPAAAAHVGRPGGVRGALCMLICIVCIMVIIMFIIMFSINGDNNIINISIVLLCYYYY